jgi:hypothetical protein
MAVLALDPAQMVDEFVILIEEALSGSPSARFGQEVQITGVQYLDKLTLYRVLLENMENSLYRYGQFIDPNKVLIAHEDMLGYLEDVADDICDMIGDFGCLEEDGVITQEIDGIEYTEVLIEDESEAFERLCNEYDPKLIIEEMLTEAFECAIIIVTGSQKSLRTGKLEI